METDLPLGASNIQSSKVGAYMDHMHVDYIYYISNKTINND